MSTKFAVGEIVIIKAYKNDPYNCKGVVKADVSPNYWVANLNMPFCGNISDFFTADELEKVA